MSKPPTTAWGALLVAADILERSTTMTDLDPYAALQEALWPGEEVPLDPSGRVRTDRLSGRPYWTALARLDFSLGGTGNEDLAAVHRLLEPDATAASVAEAMRAAARSTTASKAVS